MTDFSFPSGNVPSNYQLGGPVGPMTMAPPGFTATGSALGATPAVPSSFARATTTPGGDAELIAMDKHELPRQKAKRGCPSCDAAEETKKQEERKKAMTGPDCIGPHEQYLEPYKGTWPPPTNPWEAMHSNMEDLGDAMAKTLKARQEQEDLLREMAEENLKEL